jgi:hypothetical protein
MTDAERQDRLRPLAETVEVRKKDSHIVVKYTIQNPDNDPVTVRIEQSPEGLDESCLTFTSEYHGDAWTLSDYALEFRLELAPGETIRTAYATEGVDLALLRDAVAESTVAVFGTDGNEITSMDGLQPTVTETADEQTASESMSEETADSAQADDADESSKSDETEQAAETAAADEFEWMTVDSDADASENGHHEDGEAESAGETDTDGEIERDDEPTGESGDAEASEESATDESGETATDESATDDDESGNSREEDSADDGEGGSDNGSEDGGEGGGLLGRLRSWLS